MTQAHTTVGATWHEDGTTETEVMAGGGHLYCPNE